MVGKWFLTKYHNVMAQVDLMHRSVNNTFQIENLCQTEYLYTRNKGNNNDSLKFFRTICDENDKIA